MAIYKGTATSTALGGYARPNNPQGKTISARQHHRFHNPTAHKLQFAMRTAAAAWQTLSPAEQRTWFTYSNGWFYRRDGAYVEMTPYAAFIALTMSPLFNDFPAWLAYHRTPYSDMPVYQCFRWNEPTQSVTFYFIESLPHTGSHYSGVSAYQIDPDYLGSPDLVHHTKHIGADTPWGHDNEVETLTAPLAWPVDHPTKIHCLIRSWDYGLLTDTVDTWSGAWNAEEPDYPEYCEGGAEKKITGNLLPCANGWFWKRYPIQGYDSYSNPVDARADSGTWIHYDHPYWKITLYRDRPFNAVWSAPSGPNGEYTPHVDFTVGRPTVSNY